MWKSKESDVLMADFSAEEDVKNRKKEKVCT